MAKRGPQSELTDRNWDDEEEPEEAGVFTQASKEAMQQRVIKKAKRRVHEDGSEGKTTAFGGFGGLVTKPALTQSNADKLTESKVSTPNESSLFTGGASSSFDNIGTMASKSEKKENSSYLHGLKSLNESVLAWIKQHVDKNPYIILSPIFKDYDKYITTLESKKTTANGSNPIFSSVSSVSQEESKPSFSSLLSKKPTDDSDSKTVAKEDKEVSKPFMFGTTSSSNGDGFKFSSATTTSMSGFSFGKNSTTSGFSFAQNSSSSTPAKTTTTTAATTGFSFGSSGGASTTPSFGSSGFSFGSLAAKSGTSSQPDSTQNKEDEDYVPPKPEIKEIKEEGSLYSKRCKLFYQKEGQWTERGVGNVHIKPLDGDKTQILVRADTNLGNILLNINLSSGLPTSRQGKNNVLLVCVPNPQLKEQKDNTTPIPMLVRVKSGEEADELLNILKERKALL